MIWSPGRKYLFIHIPKTAGTSMALALEARAMKDDVMLGDTPKALKRRRRAKDLPARGRLWKHSTLADLSGWIDGPDLDGVFVFTLVRNPWDRMVSYYTWLQTQGFDHPSVHLARTSTFADFVAHPATQAAWRNAPARHYVTDASGVEVCSAYIRVEHFQQDAAPLWAHLGFALDLPRENASTRGLDYASYYSDTTKDIVAEIAAEDIARFDYRFA